MKKRKWIAAMFKTVHALYHVCFGMFYILLIFKAKLQSQIKYTEIYHQQCKVQPTKTD